MSLETDKLYVVNIYTCRKLQLYRENRPDNACCSTDYRDGVCIFHEDRFLSADDEWYRAVCKAGTVFSFLRNPRAL